MAKKKSVEVDLSTEEKIKEAAQKVFLKKGYAATRTRDIAEEAGINLRFVELLFQKQGKTLRLNYAGEIGKVFWCYCARSSIMLTQVWTKRLPCFPIIISICSSLTLSLPLFILSEVRHNPERFAHKLTGSKSC